jgi:hypothetical protein
MIRYRLCLLTAALLFVSLFFAACAGSPPGPNANGAGPNTNAPARNTNSSGPTATPPANGGAAAYEGFQDDINCYNLIGWAWDAQRPNEPVKIEIFDGNTLLATVTADLFRQDLLEAHKGNGTHAFNFAIPAQLRDGKPHTIRARIAGSDIDLTYTLKQITCNNE